MGCECPSQQVIDPHSQNVHRSIDDYVVSGASIEYWARNQRAPSMDEMRAMWVTWACTSDHVSFSGSILAATEANSINR